MNPLYLLDRFLVLSHAAAGFTGLLVAPLARRTGGGARSSSGPYMTYTLAAGMGLVLGPILALAQWLRLRRHVRAAGWWVPANALAWAAGMVVVFAGVGGAATSGEALSAAIGLLAALAIAGALVGAIHGAALVWLLAGVVVETRP